MATPIVEVAEYTEDVVAPEGGDVRNAASVRTPLQALANRAAYFRDKLDGLITVTDEQIDPMSGVMTGNPNNAYLLHLGYGVYKWEGGLGNDLWFDIGRSLPLGAVTLTGLKVRFQTDDDFVSGNGHFALIAMDQTSFLPGPFAPIVETDIPQDTVGGTLALSFSPIALSRTVSHFARFRVSSTFTSKMLVVSRVLASYTYRRA